MPINFDVDGHIATITIEGSNDHNPLVPEMYVDLNRRLLEVETDPEIRVAILHGAGRHFSVGGNLRRTPGTPSRHTLDRHWYSVGYEEEGSRPYLTPVIGATRGWCLGAALVRFCELTSIRIAGESSRFGFTELRWAMAGAVASSMIDDQVPHSTTMWMATTSQHIDADEALRIGFVNEVVPDERVLTRAREVAECVARIPRLALRAERLALEHSKRSPTAWHSSALAYSEAVLALASADWRGGLREESSSSQPVAREGQTHAS